MKKYWKFLLLSFLISSLTAGCAHRASSPCACDWENIAPTEHQA